MSLSERCYCRRGETGHTTPSFLEVLTADPREPRQRIRDLIALLIFAVDLDQPQRRLAA